MVIFKVMNCTELLLVEFIYVIVGAKNLFKKRRFLDF